MTAQVPDTCMFDGRRWAIEWWEGDCSAIPSNEVLGIRTVTESTANWSGRIDHFMVCRGKLYLLKIEVNLAEDRRDQLPEKAQREVLSRYEKMWSFDKDGERTTIREHRFEYLVFHDLFIPYTGELFLSYPCIDLWEQPYDCDEDDDNDRVEMLLTFEEGILMEAREH